MSWLTAPVLWLGWAVLFLSFGMYFVFEWLCGGFYKYQNLRQRYKAEWALVTGASSGVHISTHVLLGLCCFDTSHGTKPPAQHP
jgi:hypothetical protein